MTTFRNTPPRLLLSLVAAGTMVSLAQVGHAQTQTITYELQNVWLDPDNGNPRQMTGTFTWTYDVGDFENGAGAFTELYIPWGGYGIDDLNITIEQSSLETSLIGNWHDRGCDVSLKFVEPLSTDQPSDIDLVLSSFDIQYGVSYQGQPISGSVVPVSSSCTADFNNDGTVNTLDVLAFLNAWSAGDQAGDFNNDGNVNTLDVLAFLNAWTTGC